MTTLNTLAGYIDWIALPHVTNDNCRLLEMLCLLLGEAELQLEAVECLLIAISRKVGGGRGLRVVTVTDLDVKLWEPRD